MQVGTLLVAAVALALERASYIAISRRPGAFRALLAAAPGGDQSAAGEGIQPVTAVALLFVGFKVIQLSVFAWWIWGRGDRLPLPSAPVGLQALAAGLIVGGQILNLRVFQLLGAGGAFYGNRFGQRLPWRHEFPFSVLSHPQYVGTCLSIWGLFLLARYPHADWYALPLLETAYYAVGAALER